MSKTFLTLVYLSHKHVYRKGVVPPRPQIFAVKSLILMILVLGDSYESPLSIDTKIVTVSPASFDLTMTF